MTQIGRSGRHRRHPLGRHYVLQSPIRRPGREIEHDLGGREQLSAIIEKLEPGFRGHRGQPFVEAKLSHEPTFS